jgi:hypothetical protein
MPKAVEPTKQTYTPWDVFNKLRLVPVEIKCNSYKPYHRTDSSCHTILQPRADVLLRHIHPDHAGGGFSIKLRQAAADAPPHPLWKELQDAGVEIIDIRSAVNDQPFKLSGQFIMQYMKPHQDGNRRRQEGGRFNFTLATDTPAIELDDTYSGAAQAS